VWSLGCSESFNRKDTRPLRWTCAAMASLRWGIQIISPRARLLPTSLVRARNPRGRRAAVSVDSFLALESLDRSGIMAPIVLVGHSMGGRVAMRLAADYPERIAALIIEDMDLRYHRAPLEIPVGSPHMALRSASCQLVYSSFHQESSYARFTDDGGRRFASWEECVACLSTWYHPSRLEGYKGSRIRQLTAANTHLYPVASTPSPPRRPLGLTRGYRSQGDGQAGDWWSDLNPMAKRLGARNILMSDDGLSAWAVRNGSIDFSILSTSVCGVAEFELSQVPDSPMGG
jgi:pimeloyl-ACP methyl ester carboxylesterase